MVAPSQIVNTLTIINYVMEQQQRMYGIAQFFRTKTTKWVAPTPRGGAHHTHARRHGRPPNRLRPTDS